MRFSNSQPLWEQLVGEFTRRIVTGQWQPGAAVPSVRTLAMSLGVNPNTVQKALAELERRGLAFPERTAGRFVTTDSAQIARLRRELATQVASDFVQQIRGLEVDKAAALDLVDEHWNDQFKDSNEDE